MEGKVTPSRHLRSGRDGTNERWLDPRGLLKPTLSHAVWLPDSIPLSLTRENPFGMNLLCSKGLPQSCSRVAPSRQVLFLYSGIP